MKSLAAFLVAGLLTAIPTVAAAQATSLDFGGDHYAAGQSVAVSTPAGRDVFLAGSDVAVSAPVTGDAHLAGFNVISTADVSGNLYAAGFSVTVTGHVAGDITAIANSVSLSASDPLAGNARLAAAMLSINAPIEGSVLASSATMMLNAPIKGDLSFYGDTLSFGPNAKVGGKLSIQAPKPVSVPDSVASQDRVSYTQLTTPDYVDEAGKTATTLVKGFWFALWAALLWWLLLLVVGAATISLLPGLVGNLQAVSARRPFRRIGLGILTLASVVGLVPVVALTLIGLFLVPFVLIYVVAACSAAYLAGAYLVGYRILGAAMKAESTGRKIGLLAISLVVAGLLTMIPFIGWLITLLLLTFGFGAIAAVVMAKWSADDAVLLAATPSAT